MRRDYSSLRQGLLGAWCPSLGATGYRLIDRSGRNNHGTLTNMDGQNNWQAIGTGVGAFFDGTNDYINLKTMPELNQTTKASVSAWAVPTGFPLSTNGVIFSQKGTGGYNATNDTFELGITKSSVGLKWYFECGKSGFSTGWLQANSAASPVDGQIYHLTGTYDGSNLRIYVNGILSGTTACTQTSGTQNNTCFIGTSSLNSGGDLRRFKGTIDDVRVYNRVLTPQEILLLASRRGIGLTPVRQRRTSASSRRLYANVAGTWKETLPLINVGGNWKEAAVYQNVGGVWKN